MKKILLSLKLVVFATILNAQNVGIGTPTPQYPLHIVATNNSNPLVIDGASNSYYSILENGIYRGYWGSYAGNPEDVDFGTGGGNGTGKLHLTIQGTPKMTINPAGQVGIGTTTPAYLLDVANRMRLRAGTLNNIFTTAGTWYDDYRNGSDRMFAGMLDSIRWGIYGGGTGGVGWGFNYSAKTGNVNIGNSTGETYRLQLSGSDYGLGMYNASGAFYGDILTSATNDLQIESSYSSIFAGTTAKNILLNPPSSTIFFAPGNVGVNTSTPNARFHVGGNVYIGTSAGLPATGYQLSVKGKIISEEVKVALSTSWPDYVFGKDYKLTDLGTLENYILQNNHLPNIPPAAEIEKNGFELGDMQRRSIEKIEELTLLLIQLNKQNMEFKNSITELQNKVKHLESRQ